MSNRLYLLFCLFLCFSLGLLAQKQTYYWYFGNGAGLNFNTNPPTVLTNSMMRTLEGVLPLQTKMEVYFFILMGLRFGIAIIM